MKQLSGLDASFLYLETPQMPMHVGALHILELPAGYKGRFVRDLRRHMAARLPVTPALRRKVWWMPLNLANPAWVDAQPDLDVHIVEIKLPRKAGGNGLAELEAKVGELHPVLLDRSRPLWKFHVFEGLAPGPDGHKRVALYSQLHHAAVDGQAAVALAAAILDVTAEPRTIDIKPSQRVPTYRLGVAQMLRTALASQAQQVVSLVRELPSTVGTLGGAAGSIVSRSSLLRGKAAGEARGKLTLAPRTRLNVSITGTRAFAAVTLPLAELKVLGKRHGATLNDVVLWLVSTALRREFGKLGELPRKSMIAAVPVSLREKGDAESDNQASMTLLSLGTNIAEPAKRLAHIVAAGASMKQTLGKVKGILPTDFPSLGIPWLMEALTSLYGKAKVADRLPPIANVVVSNVPGPPMPLYLAGARMLTNYPTSIVTHGLALNVTVQSYAGSLDFGLIACAAAMPDLRPLAGAIAVALDDLRALPGAEPEEAASSARKVIAGTRKAMGRAVKQATGAASGRLAKAVGTSVAKAISKPR
jgi:WS/DGAT/MGAT family acyltransferase